MRPSEENVGNILRGDQSRYNLQVHHISYERVGNERFGDLIVICDECHGELERFISRVGERFGRRKVMERLAPYCIRRLLAIHDFYKAAGELSNCRHIRRERRSG